MSINQQLKSKLMLYNKSSLTKIQT